MPFDSHLFASLFFAMIGLDAQPSLFVSLFLTVLDLAAQLRMFVDLFLTMHISLLACFWLW